MKMVSTVGLSNRNSIKFIQTLKKHKVKISIRSDVGIGAGSDQ